MSVLLFEPGGLTRRVSATWHGRGLVVRGLEFEAEVDATRLALQPGGWQDASAHLIWIEEGHSWALTVQGQEALAALATGAPEPLAAALRAALERARRARGRGRRAVALLVFLVLLPLLALLLLWAFRDALADAVVRRLPHAVDAQVGALVEAQARAQGQLAADGAALRAVRQTGQRLTARLSTPHSFRFELARDPSVNAYAAPGGFVVVHAGLLAAAEGPEELAGVLAHEVGHVTRRHSLRQMVFQAGFAAALRLVLGSPDGAVGVLAGSARQLSSLGFSREQEREADLEALLLLQQARLPADGLARFFGRLSSQAGGAPAWLSTHPDPGQRARLLLAELERRGAWPVEPLEVEWQAARAELAAPAGP